jgi:hypothetical protein
MKTSTLTELSALDLDLVCGGANGDVVTLGDGTMGVEGACHAGCPGFMGDSEDANRNEDARQAAEDQQSAETQQANESYANDHQDDGSSSNDGGSDGGSDGGGD